MTIKQQLINICVCDICGYEWMPKEKDPRVCPRCKRHSWNKIQEIEI